MAALDRLAKVYETFEDTWAFAEKECAEGDVLLAAEEEGAIDKMEAAQQHQVHILDELEGCRNSLDSAFREFNNCRALHEATWADLKEVSLRHTELKRKADDAHETRPCPMENDFVVQLTTTQWPKKYSTTAWVDWVLLSKALLGPLMCLRVACQIGSRTKPNILKKHWR